MRNNVRLLDTTENMKVIYQYLYMSEEHAIIVNNRMTDLELSMDDDGNILCRNMNYPDLPKTRYNDKMNLAVIEAIVSQLEAQPAQKDYFNNRWEEVKEITNVNAAHNAMTSGRM